MNAPVPDFEGMTKGELLEYAESQGVEGLDKRMKKSEIIAEIEEAMTWK